MTIPKLILLAFGFITACCLAQSPPLTKNERLIGELMLSHNPGNLRRALKRIYSELEHVPNKSKAHWLSLAGLCELEIASSERVPGLGEEGRKRGFRILIEAASLGDANAAMTLSDMYRNGEPPASHDLVKAKYWNDRALVGRGGK